MEERRIAPTCERGNDLVAFLYNEVNEVEARDFQLHMSQCAECKSELASFRDIRDSVIDWRQESLGILNSQTAVSVPTPSRSLAQERPSAFAAIRQFFELSPLWLKGAVACAVLLFCMLAGLAVSRLPEKPAALVASDKRYSETELKAKVEEGVQTKLEKLSADKAKNESVVAQANKPTKKISNAPKESAVYVPRTKRAPLTRSERQQLAADLRLILPKDDTDVGLLGEGINQ